MVGMETQVPGPLSRCEVEFMMIPGAGELFCFDKSISGHVYLNWLIILPFLGARNGQAGWWDGHKMPNGCNTWRTHGPRRVLSQSTGLLVEGRSTINQAWAAHGFTVSFGLTTWTLRVDFQKEGQQEFWSAGFTGIMCYNSSLFMMVASLFPIATTIAVDYDWLFLNLFFCVFFIPSALWWYNWCFFCPVLRRWEAPFADEKGGTVGGVFHYSLGNMLWTWVVKLGSYSMFNSHLFLCDE